MTSESREELISAYIDGELSADERARVEGWLAESAEMRQLHDELRAVAGSLHALPRHKLDQNLADAVVRRAERTVLAGTADVPVAGKVSPASALESWRARSSWRRWVWPGIAIAAALAILVYDRRQAGPEREVAQVPQRDLAIQAAPADHADAPSLHAGAEMKSAGGAAGGLKDGPRAEPSAAAARSRSDQNSLYNEAHGADRLKRAAKAPAGAAPSAVEEAMPAAGAAAGAPATQSAAAQPAINLRMSRPLAAAAGESRDLAESVELHDGAAEDAGGEERVAFEVPDEYIRQRDFEKLLDTNKLPWQRAQVVAAPDEKNPRDKARLADRYAPVAKEAALPPTAPRVDYFVEATPEQVDEIVVELRNTKRGVNQIGGYAPVEQRVNRAGDIKQKTTQQAPQQRRVIFTLQTPLGKDVPAAPGEKTEP